ncbi:MAG: lipopolysaccharide transport periplasmic protein LptA [Betaproteobacteria bacterium]|nr:lipopolysaccharide transport periplasmic protein LptA [Betaproteobacteria bacterium]
MSAACRPASIFLAIALASAAPARAEKADKDKPTQIEANSMQSDETRRLNIFEGNVVVTKGTLTVRSERLVVRQDPEGYQLTTATGAPVHFRQRQDPKEPGKEGGWMDGEALRLEIDDRKGTIELFDKARVNRDGDEVTGNYILVDQRSDYFSVNNGPKNPPGRVKAIIQPKANDSEGAK